MNNSFGRMRIGEALAYQMRESHVLTGQVGTLEFYLNSFRA